MFNALHSNDRIECDVQNEMKYLSDHMLLFLWLRKENHVANFLTELWFALEILLTFFSQVLLQNVSKRPHQMSRN